MSDENLTYAPISVDTADVYFLRTQAILAKERIDPVVAMEVFPSQAGIFCGITEVVKLLCAVTPTGEICALAEGEPMNRKEVVLRIRARYSSFGLYETAILGMLASQSGWATAARSIVDAAGPIPVMSFGARHVHPAVAAQLEYASIIGGCITGATTAGARLAGRQPSGTMPHAMVLIFGDSVKAIEAFDRWMPDEINRIALVDTFHDEGEEAIRVAQALGDRLWGIRLDTPSERGGVTPDLVTEVRTRLNQAGFPGVRIIVSGGINVERVKLFRAVSAPVDAFGVGSAISAAPPIDFTADLKEIEGKPIAKRGRIPGVTNNPRLEHVTPNASSH